MRRIGIVALILVAASGAAYGGLMVALKWRFDRDAPQADFPPPSDRAEARAQDVEHLALFFELERSLTPETRAEAMALYESLEREAAGLSDAEFEMAVSRLVAAARNGHTKVREYSRTPRYNRLPIRGHLFDDGYYVVRAHEDHEELLGCRVTRIDERPIEEVMGQLEPYVGGLRGMFRKYLPYLLESPELMHAVGLSDASDRMTLTLVGPDGAKAETFAAPFPPSHDLIGRSHVLLAPEAYRESKPEWRSVVPPGMAVPAYLQFLLDNTGLVEMPDLEAVFLKYWSNSDGAEITLREFQRRALRRLEEVRPRHIILDERFNGGGNYLKTRRFMQGLAELLRPDGRLFIITGPSTFSAGTMSVAYAKQAAGDKAVILGDRVADRAGGWGEDNLLVLPNSGIEIKYSTGKHDPFNGCRSWKDCFWWDLVYPVAAGSLDPDIDVPFTFADYRAGRDPALEAIRAQL